MNLLDDLKRAGEQLARYCAQGDSASGGFVPSESPAPDFDSEEARERRFRDRYCIPHGRPLTLHDLDIAERMARAEEDGEVRRLAVEEVVRRVTLVQIASAPAVVRARMRATEARERAELLSCLPPWASSVAKARARAAVSESLLADLAAELVERGFIGSVAAWGCYS